MKYFSTSLIFLLFILIFSSSFADDALTVKQQLDRIIEEVSDLNKAVFNKSFDKKKLYSNEEENDMQRFTSLDIRIYDLEKDIKNLTLQFEEILFKLDDISNNMNSLEAELFDKFEIIEFQFKKTGSEVNKEEITQSTLVKEENTLGKLIISDTKQVSGNVESKNLAQKREQEKKINNQQNQEIINMSAEAQLQFALDQMRKKDFDRSKKTLENFVTKFPENQLSGSAYFWLGKIYLFELNYRDAALVFGEGVQKFPKSIKAGEMYYELVKSLKEMSKISEACKTYLLFKENYSEDKFAKDPDKIFEKLNCEN